MRRFNSFIAATILSVCSISAANATSILGKWEYRSANPDKKTGFDSEGERIEIKELGGKAVGYYLGIERLGEEGLYYTAVILKDLVIDKENVSFVVPRRSLYAKRPKSISDAGAMSAIGNMDTELTMTGKIESGKLILHCTWPASKWPDSTCPDEKMTFGKSKW